LWSYFHVFQDQDPFLSYAQARFASHGAKKVRIKKINYKKIRKFRRKGVKIENSIERAMLFVSVLGRLYRGNAVLQII